MFVQVEQQVEDKFFHATIIMAGRVRANGERTEMAIAQVPAVRLGTILQ
jgi:hypothetical protein